MKILIVDDDVLSSIALQEALHQFGHECAGADGVQRAMELFGDDRPDVVISDWTMAEVDGLGLRERIRQGASALYVSLILLFEADDEERALTGMLAGADYCLAKPLNINNLKMALIAAERTNVLQHRLSRHQDKLRGLNAQIEQTARIDPLTGLGNELRLQEDLAILSAKVARYGETYCFAVLGVDNLKEYNETFGSLEEDRVLQAVASLIAGAVRGGDAVYRRGLMGGDNFVCILSEQSQKSVVGALERIRQTVQDLAIAHPANTPTGVITISAAASWPVSLHSVAAERLLDEADVALFLAKEKGGNRVEVAVPRQRGCARVDAR
jgi:two-component system cell cycle response regulator